jgi:hypothetical protein
MPVTGPDPKPHPALSNSYSAADFRMADSPPGGPTDVSNGRAGGGGFWAIQPQPMEAPGPQSHAQSGPNTVNGATDPGRVYDVSDNTTHPSMTSGWHDQASVPAGEVNDGPGPAVAGGKLNPNWRPGKGITL